ncbi:hypothetical protein [Pseudomonas subflava]|uniref:hypothetical protein n=1 Tax=Pseudomonas subflava TaxID=2952933 RepID=UPI00207A4B71|nr:hypothetical protein [Pseudomonas subflava]
MAQWIISYSKDNNTSTLEMQAADKPDMEAAVRHVLAWAEAHLEKGDFGDVHDRECDEPAVLLLRHYGITLTGISAA